MKSDITNEGRERLSKAISKRNLGKKLASKGPYTFTRETGEKITEQSFQDISDKVNIPYATLQHRFVKNKGKFMKGWKIE